LDPDSALQSYLEGGLALFGIEADDGERAVMQGVWGVYGPGLVELLEADLGEIEPEPCVDLSKPPPK
jgi:hypothetical protein